MATNTRIIGRITGGTSATWRGTLKTVAFDEQGVLGVCTVEAGQFSILIPARDNNTDGSSQIRVAIVDGGRVIASVETDMHGDLNHGPLVVDLQDAATRGPISIPTGVRHNHRRVYRLIGADLYSARVDAPLDSQEYTLEKEGVVVDEIDLQWWPVVRGGSIFLETL